MTDGVLNNYSRTRTRIINVQKTPTKEGDGEESLDEATNKVWLDDDHSSAVSFRMREE